MPLAEHDDRLRASSGGSWSFNSRAPRGARQIPLWLIRITLLFQFTCPSRSTTTLSTSCVMQASRFQFTCPSRSTTAEYDIVLAASAFQFTCPSRSTTACGHAPTSPVRVSIHVPLAEHDEDASTTLNAFDVSIHVPLAEHDGRERPVGRRLHRFNSRAPRGARPSTMTAAACLSAFQFTCPSRSTTLAANAHDHFLAVSIHVPLAEHDARMLLM